ncbi:hypothetical protein RI367_006190 [Sorochytrium milnesiophthora]
MATPAPPTPPPLPLTPPPQRLEKRSHAPLTAAQNEHLAHHHPHLVSLKVCQRYATREGYTYAAIGLAAAALVGVSSKMKPNNIVLASFATGGLAGFAAASTSFYMCSSALGKMDNAHAPQAQEKLL